MPKVSVVVPVHNTAQYIRNCVQSITKQTLEDIEIILVENASTDNSIELCYQIAKEDKRIKVLQIAKGDLSTARNEGVKIAESEYIGFVDSDDTIEPEMYEKMYQLAVEHNLGLVNCNCRSIYDNKPPKYNFPQDGKMQILSAEEMTTLNFLGEIPRSAWANLYKKSLFEEVVFPEDVLHEDRASTFLFMSKCGKGAVINKSYYNYYQRKGSIIHTKNYRNYRDFALACCKSLEYIQQSSYYTPEQKATVAQFIAITFLRKLRHTIILGRKEHKEEVLDLCKKISLIPSGTKLSFKTRLIKFYVKRIILRQ